MSLHAPEPGGALWRFFLAAVMIIAATAATTAVAGLLQFKQLAADLSGGPAMPHADVTCRPRAPAVAAGHRLRPPGRGAVQLR